MSYVAVDKQGKVADGKRDAVDMSLKPETYERVLAGGHSACSRGSNCRRAATSSAWRRGRAAARTGSVHYDLIVPDFATDAAQHERPRA